MLLHHDDVDALWILEGEEAEASRTACGGVSHDSAFADFAEL